MIAAIPYTAVELMIVGFELVGVAVITLGSILACGRFVTVHKALEYTARCQALRQDLGSAIVLGLEFLVAGDIMRTVAVDPTLQGVAVLGLIVLIRTFLSFTLRMEIEGAPWQRLRGAGRDRASPDISQLTDWSAESDSKG